MHVLGVGVPYFLVVLLLYLLHLSHDAVIDAAFSEYPDKSVIVQFLDRDLGLSDGLSEFLADHLVFHVLVDNRDQVALHSK